MSRKLITLILAGLLVLLLASVVLAAPQVFDLSWWTVDSGGGTSAGGNYELDGTIGQPEAGYQMTGGNYNLEGGFWGGGETETHSYLYLPVISR